MVQIILVADMKRGPAGIGDPMMFSCQTLCQEPVPNRPGKGNVNHAAFMHVSEFGVSETKFAASEAVRVKRYVRPACDFLFDLLQVCHSIITELHPSFLMIRSRAAIRRYSATPAKDKRSRNPTLLKAVNGSHSRHRHEWSFR